MCPGHSQCLAQGFTYITMHMQATCGSSHMESQHLGSLGRRGHLEGLREVRSVPAFQSKTLGVGVGRVVMGWVTLICYGQEEGTWGSGQCVLEGSKATK